MSRFGSTRRALLLSITTAAVPAAAKSHGKGKAEGRSNGNRGKANARGVRFGREEVPVFAGYYRSPASLPPGLAKRGGDLPPGLKKQLRRNGRLPPGLERKIQPFSTDLEGQLPPPPSGYRRVVAGTRALLIAGAANAVMDSIDLSRR